MCFWQSRAEDNQRGDFEGLEMQNQNISTDRTQWIDNKSGLICLVLFSFWFMVIEIEFIFCIFSWRQQKTSHSLGKLFKSASEKFYSAL